MPDEDWPFDDPKNVAVFTCAPIVNQEDWIQLVRHDEEDGAWQFHPSDATPLGYEPMIVGLEKIVKLEPRIKELFDLPYGWLAWRESPDGEWLRREQ